MERTCRCEALRVERRLLDDYSRAGSGVRLQGVGVGPVESNPACEGLAVPVCRLLHAESLFLPTLPEGDTRPNDATSAQRTYLACGQCAFVISVRQFGHTADLRDRSRPRFAARGGGWL